MTRAHLAQPISRTSQRGITLLESLVAFVVLAAGTAAVAQLQSHLRLASDVARDRTEGEVRRHLAAKGVEVADIERSIATLSDQGYVDDARYARLFAQDTFVVARNTFLDELTKVKHMPGLDTLTDQKFPSPGNLSVNGYNLCYLRPEATLGTVTVDEYRAPVAAAWQAGSGRVLCYTGEADGKYAGAIAGWKEVGDYFTSLARWTAGQTGPLPGNMLTRPGLLLNPWAVRSTQTGVETPKDGGAYAAVGISADQLHSAGLHFSRLFDSPFAHQLLLRLVPVAVAAPAVIAALVIRRTPGLRRAAVAAAGVLGVAGMWCDVSASHVAAARTLRWGRMAVQLTHFAAAAIWVGGLAVLLLGLRGLAPESRGRVARRFSAVALVAVAAIAGTGVQRAFDSDFFHVSCPVKATED